MTGDERIDASTSFSSGVQRERERERERERYNLGVRV